MFMRFSDVYICHTFYHVYVALLMEFNKAYENQGKSDILLSTMSNDFSSMYPRLEASGVFNKVYLYEEKEASTFPELEKYRTNKGNLVSNLVQRYKYTKLLGKLEERFVPTDLTQYDNVFVFCDSDPIGYYLNYKKIHYSALEDGLNSGRLDDQARNSNPGHFGLKCLLARLGFIFIESGYSKYCDAYIVNDINENLQPPKNIKEQSFSGLCKNLTEVQHAKMVNIFLGDKGSLTEALDVSRYGKKAAMILTEPLCDLDTRKQIFKDIIEEYAKGYMVIIKPHPRDVLDYEKEFLDSIVIREKFPMEVMNDIHGLKVSKVISVITQTDCIQFADEIVYLGLDFLDRYEDPAVHRKAGLGDKIANL